MKRTLVIILILIFIVSFIALAKADVELPIMYCGGDQELLIPCIGDEEINVMGLDPMIVGSTIEQAVETPQQGKMNKYYLFIIIFLIILAFFLLIFILIKRRKKKQSQ